MTLGDILQMAMYIFAMEWYQQYYLIAIQGIRFTIGDIKNGKNTHSDRVSESAKRPSAKLPYSHIFGYLLLARPIGMDFGFFDWIEFSS